MLKNCKKCHTLFTHAKYDLCPSCIEEEKSIVQLLKTYLSTHRQATTFEIIRDTSVDFETLMEMVRDGRLTVTM